MYIIVCRLCGVDTISGTYICRLSIIYSLNNIQAGIYRVRYFV